MMKSENMFIQFMQAKYQLLKATFMSFKGVYLDIIIQLVSVWKYDAVFLLLMMMAVSVLSFSMLVFPEMLICITQAYLSGVRADIIKSWGYMLLCLLGFSWGSALRMFSVTYLSEQYVDRLLETLTGLWKTKYFVKKNSDLSSEAGNNIHDKIADVKRWIQSQMSQTLRFSGMFLGAVISIAVRMPYMVTLAFVSAVILVQSLWSYMQTKRSMKKKPQVSYMDEYLHLSKAWVLDLWRYPVITLRVQALEASLSGMDEKYNKFMVPMKRAMFYFVSMFSGMMLTMGVLISIFHMGIMTPKLMSELAMLMMLASSALIMLIDEYPMHVKTQASLHDIARYQRELESYHSMASQFHVTCVTFNYGDVSCSLVPGLWFLTGVNGAGKTTLLNDLRMPSSSVQNDRRVKYSYRQKNHEFSHELNSKDWIPQVVYCKTEMDNMSVLVKNNSQDLSRGQIQSQMLDLVLTACKEQCIRPLLLLDDVMNCLDSGNALKMYTTLSSLSSDQIIVMAMPDLPSCETLRLSQVKDFESHEGHHMMLSKCS